MESLSCPDLTDGELSELNENYPNNTDKYINKLSTYMECTGKRYNSHFATLKKWLTDDIDKGIIYEEKASKEKYYDFLNIFDCFKEHTGSQNEQDSEIKASL